MSKGPGRIESRIAELFAEAKESRALSVDEITDHAFVLGGKRTTRAQRLSATRAAHRVLKRVLDIREKRRALLALARKNTERALGRSEDGYDKEFEAKLKTDPAAIEAKKLWKYVKRIGLWTATEEWSGRGMKAQVNLTFETWRTTIDAKKRLYFHPPNIPVRLWAVSIQPAGVIWADAEIVRLTERNVIGRYAGEHVRLDREKLCKWRVWWRGVIFVCSRSGRIAAELDNLWQDRYGRTYAGSSAPPPAAQMPLVRAMELLGVPANFNRDDVIQAFRRAVKKVHPDAGGTAELFRMLVEARDRLLASIGTSAPAPKMPNFDPIGTKYRRRVTRTSGTHRIGQTRRLAG